MRISEVRFQNLNSLMGEWHIDFTLPAFTTDGIFAIIGDTGAGKTTILDAICLALYGRTPRLGKITKSENEIMSKQSGECFAEVTFETQKGSYRAFWYQHRARRKPEGELQHPKHEIVDADKEIVLETKLREVPDKIEEVTGMDFNRFTRSMLLAQGDFAAFLQAAPDERAPILEQITGTDIYSQISVKVHERKGEEKKKLDKLQAELSGMQLLSEDEESLLEDELKQNKQRESEINDKITESNRAIVWLDGINDLTAELEQIEEQSKEQSLREAEFQPDLKRLELNNRTLLLDSEHALLSSLRRDQQKEKGIAEILRQNLPEAKSSVESAEKSLKNAVEELKQAKLELKSLQPVLRQVQELDVKLKEKEPAVNKLKERVNKSEEAVKKLSDQLQQDVNQSETYKKKLDVVCELLRDSERDEGLIENLAVIKEGIKSLQEIEELRREKSQESEEHRKEKEKLSEEVRKGEEKLRSCREECLKTGNLLKEKETELQQILKNRAIEDWREDLTELKNQRAEFIRIGELVQSKLEAERDLLSYAKQSEELLRGKETLSAEIESKSKELNELEKRSNSLEEDFHRCRKVKSYEEARKSLQEDEPCPLCGSSEHPYVTERFPEPEEAEIRFRKAKQAVKDLSEVLSELKIKQAKREKELLYLTEKKKDLSESISRTENRIKERLYELAIDIEDKDIAKLLERHQKENEKSLTDYTEILQQAEKKDKELTALRQVLEQAKESLNRAEREHISLSHRQERGEENHQRLEKEVLKLSDQFNDKQKELLKETAVFGVQSLPAEGLKKIVSDLSGRRENRINRQKERTGLEKKIPVLEKSIEQTEKILRDYKTELERQKGELTAVEAERKNLKVERQRLFGDKNPDKEEKKLSETIEKSEEKVDKKRKSLEDVRQELKSLEERIAVLDKAVFEREKTLQREEKVFLERLEKQGFDNEEAYIKAKLPADEQKSLLQKEKDLSRRRTELEGKRGDKQKLLIAEKEKNITKLPREQLVKDLESFLSLQKEIHQKRGGISQKLEDNNSLKEKQKERTKRVKNQMKECARWDKLHELIGSSDGKKYRNFAQGLTFEMMIKHANRQLVKMSDRYILYRDEKEPLELNVIDNYQAGTIRSTKNLSGGESFIVSLSLALGLSQMASRNVRVDSLFLDEGFGTLDEEALETALDTLAGLRHDGKLIGVISHVGLLKERISNRIEVIRQTGGRSEIRFDL